jgi:ABC-type sugar transport system permease subunit
VLRTRSWTPYLYVAPLVALLGLVFGYPMLRVVDFSLRRVRGSGGPFVGLENYRIVLTDPMFHEAALHSFQLLLAVPVLVGISLVLSVLLYDRVAGWKAYRTVFFLPYILSIPVAGIVFSYLFQFNGVLNEGLRAAGLGGWAQDWIGSSRLALWSVMLVIVWREVGFGIILFLARLLGMSEEVMEAARLDGTTWWQRLRWILLPELRGTMEFYVVVSVITMLAWVFSYVWSMTKGGPGTATQILELYIYNQGLANSLPGVAAAVAVLLLAAMLPAVLLLRRWRAAEALS